MYIDISTKASSKEKKVGHASLTMLCADLSKALVILHAFLRNFLLT